MQNKQIEQKQKTKRMPFYKQSWFAPLVAAIVIIGGLFFYRKQKDKAAKFPFGTNYTTMSKLKNAIETGVGPNGEKTFLISFGSRSCPACKYHYKIMKEYRESFVTKTLKNGYVPYYTTDADLEPGNALEIGAEIQDSKYRKWTDASDKYVKQVATPTFWYIKDGKIVDIIVGAAEKKEHVIEYIKSKN